MARARASTFDAEAEVGRAVIALYMAEPFYAHVLHGLPRRIDDSTATAAVALVGGTIELRIGPTFFAGLTKDERVAVIKHEVLHVVLKHLLRSGGRQPLPWNVACDIVVNGLIGKWRLPEGAITRDTFPDLDLPEDATADQIYAKLVALQRALREQGGGTQGAPQSAEALERLTAMPEDAVGGHSDHSAWDGRRAATGEAAPEQGAEGVGGAPHVPTGPGALAAEAAVDGMLVRAADRTSAGAWGSVPGVVRAAVDAARERGRPKVDWRRALRIFSAGAGRTRLVTTTRRESARYGNANLPGRAADPREPSIGRLVAGTKIKRLNSLLVAVDTSGSIGATMLEAFFDEIDAIWRSGANVVVVPCDAAVHEAFAYQGRAPERLGGGGGTAFEPVFAWMRAERGRRFDGVVYLTDGHGPAPTTRPPCKLLWVVTSRDGMGDHLRFGRQILLDGERG